MKCNYHSTQEAQSICEKCLFDRQLFDYTPLLKNSRLVGSIIIVVGIFSLMNEMRRSSFLNSLFGEWYYLIWGSLIPLCLIIGGIYLIAKAKKSTKAISDIGENQ